MAFKNHGPGGCCCEESPPPCMCSEIIGYSCKCLTADHVMPTPVPSSVVSISGSCVSKPLSIGLTTAFPTIPGGPSFECELIDDICDCSLFDGVTGQCVDPPSLTIGGATWYNTYHYVCSGNRGDGFGDADYYYVVSMIITQETGSSGGSCFHRVIVNMGSWPIRVTTGTSVITDTLLGTFVDGSTLAAGGSGLLIPATAPFQRTLTFTKSAACKLGWKYTPSEFCTEECNEEVPVVACYTGDLTLTSDVSSAGSYNGCDLSGLTIGVSL